MCRHHLVVRVSLLFFFKKKKVLTVRCATFWVFRFSGSLLVVFPGKEEERFFRHLCSECSFVVRAGTGDGCFASRATLPSSFSPLKKVICSGLNLGLTNIFCQSLHRCM